MRSSHVTALRRASSKFVLPEGLDIITVPDIYDLVSALSR